MHVVSYACILTTTLYTYMIIYVLYNLLWEYKEGRFHCQLFPPLLLYWDPQLLCTYTYLLVPTLATGVPPVTSCAWPYTILTRSDGQILTMSLSHENMPNRSVAV